MTIPNTDPRIIAIPIILDELIAIIDHANQALDAAHNYDLQEDVNDILDIKMQAWNMHKRLKLLLGELTYAK